MSKTTKATQATNWGDMKRVLVEVPPSESGCRHYREMQDAVNKLLRRPYYAFLSSSSRFRQRITRLEGETMLEVGESEPCKWLPGYFGDCPPQFVLCAPREWFRDDVPDYTGPVK